MGILWVEEPVYTSWSRFCTVNHRALASNYQLFNMKCQDQGLNQAPVILWYRICMLCTRLDLLCVSTSFKNTVI